MDSAIRLFNNWGQGAVDYPYSENANTGALYFEPHAVYSETHKTAYQSSLEFYQAPRVGCSLEVGLCVWLLPYIYRFLSFLFSFLHRNV